MARQFSNDSQAARDASAVMAARDRAKRRRKGQIEMIIGAVFAFVGICSVVGGIAGTASAAKDVESINLQTGEQREALAIRQREQGDTPLGTIVEIDATVNCAAEAGKIVCDYQNKLSRFTRQRKESGNNNLTEEHSSTLTEFRKYFGGLSASLKGTWCEYGKWTFDSIYDYEGVSAQVTWMCYDGNKLLAVVTASYDGDKKMFSSAQIYKTTAYNQAVADDPLLKNPGGVTSDPPTSDTDPGTSDTSDPNTSTPSTSDTSDPNASTVERHPEEEWMYAWSEANQCYGYFNRDGRFLTEDEYNKEMSKYYGR